jgi:hypothetical protein
MKTRLLFAVLGACAAALGSAPGCIGSSFTEGSGGGGGSTSASTSTTNVASSSSSSSSSSQSSSGAVSTCASGEQGIFTIAVSGTGCTVSKLVPQCIAENTSTCGLTFGATTATDKDFVVNGEATAGKSGDFTNVLLKLGTVGASCDGTWNSGTLTLVCTTTGAAKAQCTVTLMATVPPGSCAVQ